MNPLVERVFHDVADLSAEARTQYFAAHPVESEIRHEVEALLAFDAGASTRLLSDIRVAAGRALPLLERDGKRCGPYRLLDVIGRGGMGTVYLAERADGEVTQRVAVKLLPPGAGDPQRERFLQERQILAALAHPNIARMLDAGHLDDGQPFLVMEYVDGKPIDVFAAGLNIRQKVALFRKVCAAAGYLHRNLVVHRDLKPANILVTADGEPKLLDFGIAKLLDLETDSTMTSMRMLTPDYASPEQVVGGTITTATDTYGLGAVLYQLLTGSPAHQFESHTAEEIAAVITSREVTRPGKRVPELKGDLEAILLKALRKDPRERYETVERLAEDLEAFLASRPVRARSGNAWYRTRKFLRRSWIPLLACASVIGSLSAGVYIANRERAIAERRFRDVRQLSNRLFAIDGVVRQLPGTTKARQLIVDTSLEYLRRLRADVRDDIELSLEVGGAYMAVAEVEGVTSGQNLGQIEAAERDLIIAEDLVLSVLRRQPANRTALLRAARIEDDRMILASFGGSSKDDLSFAGKAVQWLERLNPGHGGEAEASTAMTIYTHVAREYMAAERLEDALRLCGRVNDLSRRLHGHADPFVLSVAAQALRYLGRLDEALEAAREAVQLVDTGSAPADYRDAMDRVLLLSRKGWILGEDGDINLGRSEEAVEVLTRAFDIADKFVHQDANDEAARIRLSLAGLPLADILRSSDAGRSLAVYDHTLRHMREVPTRSLQLKEARLLAGSSYALGRLGRPAEARRRLDEAFALLSRLKLYPAEKIDASSEAERALLALADHESDVGNPAGALKVYQEIVDRLKAADPEKSLANAFAWSRIWEAMAAVERRMGRAEAAAALESRRLELWRLWERKLPGNAFVLRQMVSRAATP